jgi:NTP pyrophosphatase (non-canonical NTP hydrolase)
MTKHIQEKIVDMRRVMRLVENEIIRAWTKHPGEFHNAHEGFAVLKEEVDELWDEVKGNTAYTEDGMKEAIQTAAMGVRFVVELHDHPRANAATKLVLSD